jgi:hypothetical protein
LYVLDYRSLVYGFFSLSLLPLFLRVRKRGVDTYIQTMKQVSLLTAFCGLCFFIETGELRAQTKEHICLDNGNDPTPVSVMISHIHNKNEGMVSYKYMSMRMKGILAGGQSVDKNEVFNNYLMSPETMQMDMHMVMGMYGITDKLTLMGMINYNVMGMGMSMFTASGHQHSGGSTGDTSMAHFMQTSGLGDVKLSAFYSLIKRHNHQLLLGTGVSIPVGNFKMNGAKDDVMYPNKNYAYAMQLGSGTFDFLPYVSYLFQHNKATFSSQLSATVRTGYNSLGYKLGNEMALNTWFAYQWLPCLSNSVRIEGNIVDKIDGYNPSLYAYNEPSANTINYGGENVNCAMGTVFQLKNGVFKNSRLGVEYSVPLYQNVKGIQMKSTQTLTISYSKGF